jgi:hypothetical protein
MSLTEADSFVHSCSLGQTEHGSFVLTVEAPLDLGHEPTKTPFGRKATAYLVEAVALIANSIRRGEYESVFEPRDDQPLVSSNLCDALVDILPPDESSDLRLRSSWSPLVPPPDVRPVVLVDRTMFAPLEKLASDLRPKGAPKTAAFLGFVVEAAGTTGASGDVEGEVTLLLHVPDEAEFVKARVVLGADDYRRAVQAHLDTQAVRVRGRLRRGGRVNHLEEATEFQVIDNP